MTTLLEKISDLNDLLMQGKGLKAFEKYYHEDVVMQENNELPTVGKSENRIRERRFYSALTEVRTIRPLKVSMGEGISMVEWHFDYDHKYWGTVNYTQVAVQEWKDGLIFREKFYYRA